jgi:hypothetical protein
MASRRVSGGRRAAITEGTHKLGGSQSKAAGQEGAHSNEAFAKCAPAT